MDTLGDRLRRLRLRAGLTTKDLTERAGLKSPSHVGMIERGDRPEISAATALALAKALNCPMAYLVAGEGSDRVPAEDHPTGDGPDAATGTEG